MAYKANIERLTLDNLFYRRVLYTTEQTQLVVMSLDKGEEIGMEKHEYTTQFIRIEDGSGVAYIDDQQYNLRSGDALVIPANTYHNIKATTYLKLYTLYSPPEHPENLIQRTKV